MIDCKSKIAQSGVIIEAKMICQAADLRGAVPSANDDKRFRRKSSTPNAGTMESKVLKRNAIEKISIAPLNATEPGGDEGRLLNDSALQRGARNISREFDNVIAQLDTTEANVTRRDDAAFLRRELELARRELEVMKRERALETAPASVAPLIRAEHPPYLSFHDIEASMSKFNGSAGYLLDGWLRDIEDAAATYCWTDLQTSTYAKRLLEGDSKKLLRATAHISKWSELKAFLIKEFKPVQTSASVHR